MMSEAVSRWREPTEVRNGKRLGSPRRRINRIGNPAKGCRRKACLPGRFEAGNGRCSRGSALDACFGATTAVVDLSPRDSVHALAETATKLGEVSGFIHVAGVSPSQAPPETSLKVDLYGTALVLEEFGHGIAPGGSGVVLASQSGHRLPSLTQNRIVLATTPFEELLALPMLQPDQVSSSALASSPPA